MSVQNQEGPPLADPLAAALPRVRQVDASAMLLLSLAARVVPPHPTHLLPQTTRIPRIPRILQILQILLREGVEDVECRAL